MPVGMVHNAHLPAEFSPAEHYNVLHRLLSVLLEEGSEAMRSEWAMARAGMSRETSLDSHIGTAEIKTVRQLLGANDDAS